MKRHYLHLVMSLLAGACLAAASCSDSDEDTKLPSPNFPEAVSATIEAGGTYMGLARETSLPSTTASNSGRRPHRSRIVPAFFDAEPSTVRTPRLRTSCKNAATPGSTSAGVICETKRR